MPTQYHYSKFPPETLQWEKLIPYLGSANRAIARFDGLLNAVPNAYLFLSPLTTQEAILSSRIEGSQATLGEVLEYEATGNASQFDNSKIADIEEVNNYRKAMREAEKLLETLPLSQRLIKNLHAILLSGVRGQYRSPGQYRTNQNWIGMPGCSIETATYVPISADKLIDGMSAWEKFIHTDYKDKLVQLALLHVEFEALHPFLDGNGRLGRMFVPLFLWQKEIISSPTFYISAIFESNRDKYYSNLLAVSKENKWTEWCIFFLQAIEQQAITNVKKAKDILSIHEEMKNTLPAILNHSYVIETINWLFKAPIFSGATFKKEAGIPDSTARRILTELLNANIIKLLQTPSGRRSANYVFPMLLNHVEGKNIF